MTQEQGIDIPLTYPIIKVNFTTTVMADGRVVQKECEEILDMKRLRRQGARETLRQLLNEFIDYVETPIQPAQRDAQSIPGNPALSAPNSGADRPLLQAPAPAEV